MQAKCTLRCRGLGVLWSQIFNGEPPIAVSRGGAPLEPNLGCDGASNVKVQGSGAAVGVSWTQGCGHHVVSVTALRHPLTVAPL